ncbi:MAG TPA: DUF3795 domain-containing protein [bacterium]|nr:DUF3795 domain-containing protein [bacterium]
MEPIYDTYCGLYCGACPVVLANERGNVEQRAAEWGMKPEELACFGCRSQTTAVFCTDCGMRLCARNRGIRSCCECGEYPCEILKNFQADEHPHHSVILKNLETIREKGLDAWLAEQAGRWRCPGCGARFTWYDTKCAECGAELYDCRVEERDL